MNAGARHQIFRTSGPRASSLKNDLLFAGVALHALLRGRNLETFPGLDCLIVAGVAVAVISLFVVKLGGVGVALVGDLRNIRAGGGDLRLGVCQHGKQRGLACVGYADQTDVGDQLQLQTDAFLLRRFAFFRTWFCIARRRLGVA